MFKLQELEFDPQPHYPKVVVGDVELQTLKRELFLMEYEDQIDDFICLLNSHPLDVVDDGRVLDMSVKDAFKLVDYIESSTYFEKAKLDEKIFLKRLTSFDQEFAFCAFRFIKNLILNNNLAIETELLFKKIIFGGYTYKFSIEQVHAMIEIGSFYKFVSLPKIFNWEVPLIFINYFDEYFGVRIMSNSVIIVKNLYQFIMGEQCLFKNIKLGFETIVLDKNFENVLDVYVRLLFFVTHLHGFLHLVYVWNAQILNFLELKERDVVKEYNKHLNYYYKNIWLKSQDVFDKFTNLSDIDKVSIYLHCINKKQTFIRKQGENDKVKFLPHKSLIDVFSLTMDIDSLILETDTAVNLLEPGVPSDYLLNIDDFLNRLTIDCDFFDTKSYVVDTAMLRYFSLSFYIHIYTTLVCLFLEAPCFNALYFNELINNTNAFALRLVNLFVIQDKPRFIYSEIKPIPVMPDFQLFLMRFCITFEDNKFYCLSSQFSKILDTKDLFKIIYVHPSFFDIDSKIQLSSDVYEFVLSYLACYLYPQTIQELCSLTNVDYLQIVQNMKIKFKIIETKLDIDIEDLINENEIFIEDEEKLLNDVMNETSTNLPLQPLTKYYLSSLIKFNTQKHYQQLISKISSSYQYHDPSTKIQKTKKQKTIIYPGHYINLLYHTSFVNHVSTTMRKYPISFYTPAQYSFVELPFKLSVKNDQNYIYPFDDVLYYNNKTYPTNYLVDTGYLDIINKLNVFKDLNGRVPLFNLFNLFSNKHEIGLNYNGEFIFEDRHYNLNNFSSLDEIIFGLLYIITRKDRPNIFFYPLEFNIEQTTKISQMLSVMGFDDVNFVFEPHLIAVNLPKFVKNFVLIKNFNVIFCNIVENKLVSVEYTDIGLFSFYKVLVNVIINELFFRRKDLIPYYSIIYQQVFLKIIDTTFDDGIIVNVFLSEFNVNEFIEINSNVYDQLLHAFLHAAGIDVNCFFVGGHKVGQLNERLVSLKMRRNGFFFKYSELKIK